jgi:site-specific DNA-methyltransferase (adenine-specific)
MTKPESRRDQGTVTSSFGVGRREGHDSDPFYARFTPPVLSDDDTINRPEELLDELGAGRIFLGDGRKMNELPDNSVALVVTSPPYFVGKEYELAVAGKRSGAATIPETYVEFLAALRDVFAECRRVLEPGGRIAVNVANLGRKPYRSLSADVISILQDDLGLLLRGEVIWEKAAGSSGSCAWGSFARASNPVLRDLTERVIIASKGRFSRAVSGPNRRKRGLPHRSTITNDEFVDVTRDVWRIDAESATKVGHPAPFPVDLPRRLIDLYTYEGDIVLDPFVGSGTTVVAAARTGRIGVGYDNEPDYVELSDHRVAAELDRLERLREIGRGSSAPSTGLAPDERQDLVHDQVVVERRKAGDIARQHLADAGFTALTSKPKFPGGLIDVDWSAKAAQRSWWIVVAGSFTTHKPGLQRIESVWRLLGQATVNKTGDPLLVLTSSLPKTGSAADKALRAAGPGVIFDIVEMFDPDGQARLAHYASAVGATAIPGFWTEAELVAP